MTPWAVGLVAASFSVTLLGSSLPRLPRVGAVAAKQAALRAACFAMRLLCSSTFAASEW
jgi:hypothetical protein